MTARLMVKNQGWPFVPGQPAVAPSHQGDYHGEKIAPLFGQDILVKANAIGTWNPPQESGLHQPPQAIGEDVRRDRQLLGAMRQSAGMRSNT